MSNETKIIPRRFKANAAIEVNGNIIRILGVGSIDADRGIVEGKYEFDEFPEEVDPRVLKTVMVTGYPSVCADGDSENPFKFGDYAYSRTVDFGDAGYVRYDASCRFGCESGGVILDSVFRGTANLVTGELENCTGVAETWVPSEGGLVGSFDVCFRKANSNEFLRGRATTNYKLSNEAHIPMDVLHRHIIFPISEITSNSLRLRQDSELLS